MNLGLEEDAHSRQLDRYGCFEEGFGSLFDLESDLVEVETEVEDFEWRLLRLS